MTQLDPRPTLKFEWLEVMRGIAAIWVVLYHSSNLGGVFLQPLDHGTFVANGALGVDFFFILSGFIIALSSNRLLDQGRGFTAYINARLIRIYVPYLPIGVVMLLVYHFMPTLSGDPRSIGLISSLTLLPTNNAPALNVAWSLVFEVVFYVIFSIIFMSRKILAGVLVCWAVTIAICTSMQIELNLFSRYFLSPINFLFLSGVLLFHIKPWRMSPLMAKTMLFSGLVLAILVANMNAPSRIMVATAFVFIVASATSSYWSKFKPWKFLSILGGASYSIYLIHNPLLSVLMRVLKRLAPDINPWLCLFVTSVIAVAGGLAYWYFYEIRALKIARRLTATPEATTSRAKSLIL